MNRTTAESPTKRASRQVATTKLYEDVLIKSILGASRVNEPLHAVVENKLSERALSEENNSVLERNRALLQYVATLADSNKNNDVFNYEFVLSLINGGADINVTDLHGQSLFHEVARSWNTDVAQFLLERGGDINKTDSFGRTPLHVAVSVDFVTMTEFLLLNGANVDARTSTERQAPIHFAAKNGCAGSLKVLLGYQGDINSVDHRQRTPLQLAAQWARDKTAKILIDEGASSWVLDSFGNSALSILIDRLPHLALQALNQLHQRDGITLQDKFHLNLLEMSRMKQDTKRCRTPLETAVATRKYEVIIHPVMQRLIQNKWVKFGRFSTAIDLCFYVIFNIMWTTLSVLTPGTGEELYAPFGDKAWRLVLVIIIGLMIVYQVYNQIAATRKTVMAQKHWIQWKTDELNDDMKYCHPRWSQEEKAVRQEIKRISKYQTFSATDSWFYYDWIVLILMLAALASHVAYNQLDTSISKNVYARIASVVNLVVSVRLLESMRPFPGIGTLVIILGETAGDFLNWGFLFLLLFVPFSAAFWLIFGGVSSHPVKGFKHTDDLLYSTFQMAVGDDFNLEGLIAADPVMARILTVVYITVMTIVTLNLLIALLSDTFSRVYSNAVANTIMQRAIKIISAERRLYKKEKMGYQEHIKTNCSPEVVPIILDVNPSDSTASAAELYRDVATVKNMLYDRFGAVYGKDKASDFDKIRQNIKELDREQKALFRNLETVQDYVNKIHVNKMLRKEKEPQQDSEEKDNLASIGLDMLKSKFSTLFTDKEDAKRDDKRHAAGGKRGKRRRSVPGTGHHRARTKQRRGEKSQHEGTSSSIVPYVHAGRENPAYRKDDSSDGDEISVTSLDL